MDEQEAWRLRAHDEDGHKEYEIEGAKRPLQPTPPFQREILVRDEDPGKACAGRSKDAGHENTAQSGQGLGDANEKRAGWSG